MKGDTENLDYSSCKFARYLGVIKRAATINVYSPA